MTWKYVAYTVDYQRTVPIIFPKTLNHVDVARAMSKVISERGRRPATVDSAGFIDALGIAGVSGSSESLDNLSSRSIDATIINNMPYEFGLASMLPGVEKMVLTQVVQLLLDRIDKL